MPLNDPVPSQAKDVLNRNAEDIDKVINDTADTVTTRTGKQIKTLDKIQRDAEEVIQDIEDAGNAAIEQIPLYYGWRIIGVFSSGFTYTRRNDVGVDASGDYWSYNGALPFVVTAGTVPSAPTYTKVAATVIDTYNYATLSEAVNDTSLTIGVGSINIKERTTGNGGGAIWDIVLASSVTPNTYDIVQCVGAPSLALVLRVEDNRPLLSQLGGTFDGSGDNYDVIQFAVQKYHYLKIDSKVEPTQQKVIDVAVSDTIILDEYETLEIGNGTTLGIPSSLTSTNNPVVWLRSSYAKLVGQGLHKSFIKHENRCFDGVVKLGANSMSSQTSVCQKCLVSDLSIFGSTPYGQTSGSQDVGLHLPSPQLGGLFNYFHTIRNLGVEDVNYGIWLRGFANGLFIRNIYGANIGNTSIQSCFILHQGALDNMITDIFFNQSNDVTGLIVEDLDNTANGTPELCLSQHNTYKGMVFEQGGTTEIACDIRASRSSYFEVRDNVSIGNILFANFDEDNNTLFSGKTQVLPGDTKTKRLDSTEYINIQRATSGDSSQEGATLGEGVTNSITTDNAITLLLNRINGAGRLLDFRIGGSNVGQVYSLGSGILSFTNPNYGLQFRDTFIAPTDSSNNLVSGVLDFGQATARFSTIFSVNALDVSSDRTLKTDEEDLPQWLLDAALEIKSNVKMWRWLHKVEEQDNPQEGENARYHIGPMAQDVVSILESKAPEGFDIFSLSLISKFKDEYGRDKLSIKPAELMWVILAAM